MTHRLPQWFSGKESSCNPGAAGNTGSILGLGRSPGGGHGNPLQKSCLENPKDRGAWRAIVPRVTKSWTRLKRFSTAQHRTQESTNNYCFIVKDRDQEQPNEETHRMLPEGQRTGFEESGCITLQAHNRFTNPEAPSSLSARVLIEVSLLKAR